MHSCRLSIIYLNIHSSRTLFSPPGALTPPPPFSGVKVVHSCERRNVVSNEFTTVIRQDVQVTNRLTTGRSRQVHLCVGDAPPSHHKCFNVLSSCERYWVLMLCSNVSLIEKKHIKHTCVTWPTSKSKCLFWLSSLQAIVWVSNVVDKGKTGGVWTPAKVLFPDCKQREAEVWSSLPARVSIKVLQCQSSTVSMNFTFRKLF